MLNRTFLLGVLLSACGGSTPGSDTPDGVTTAPVSIVAGMDPNQRWQWAVARLPELGGLATSPPIPDLAAIPARGGQTQLYTRHVMLGLTENPSECARLFLEMGAAGMRTRFTAQGRMGRMNTRGEVYELSLTTQAVVTGPSRVARPTDAVTGDSRTLGTFWMADESGIHYTAIEATINEVRCAGPAQLAVPQPDGSSRTCDLCGSYYIELRGPGVVESIRSNVQPITEPVNGCPDLDADLALATQGKTIYRQGGGPVFFSSQQLCEAAPG